MMDKAQHRRGLPRIICCVLLGTGIAASFWDIWVGLMRQWASDDNYTHGFLIVPLAAYFGWERRRELADASILPSLAGLGLLITGVLLYVLGIAAAELFLARIAVLLAICGSILFLFGREHLRILRFPLLLLLLMIPLPAIVFNQIAFPLQLFASEVGEVALRAGGVPVVRDGNVLELVGLRLEVAEACSGIRSLVSLLTFAIVLGHVSGCSTARRWLLAMATAPIAIVANAARVAGLGFVAHLWGKTSVEGLIHTTSGGLVFVAAVAALLFVNSAARPRCAGAGW